jgi:hypothetical protein
MSSASPLKAAASLIQTLDIAHTEMTSFAADAARDAESARRNARAAHEIARRYQSRSFPKTKSSFDDINVSALSSRKSKPASMITRPSDQDVYKDITTITPRPKPPKPLYLQQEQYEEDNNDILAIAADLKTPPGAAVGKKGNASVTPLNGKKHSITNDGAAPQETAKTNSNTNVNQNRKSRGFHTPSSVDRIAQHHADDMLQLSMELERTKQELKSEQRMHQECKTALASIQSKASSLEEQNQRLLEELEKERRKSTQQISELEQEVNTGRLRLQAAEEDAQLALDLAKDSSDQRDQLEEQLEKALEEIRMLKASHAAHGTAVMNGGNAMALETPRRHVRFADSEDDHRHDTNEGKTPESAFGTPMSSSSTTPGPSRALVAMGRQVLRRQIATTPQDLVLQMKMTPAKSAERRLRFRQRLTELDAVMEASASATNSPARGFTPTNSPMRLLTAAASGASNNSEDNVAIKKKLEQCHAAFKILQTSGKRLDLDGYWWRDANSTSIGGKPTLSHPIQLDAMARQYCQNVEVSCC